jgi:hypothetical protein
MASSANTYAGSLGGHFTLHLQCDEISVDTPNNRSLVNVSLWITVDSTGTGVYDLYTTYGNVSVDGNVVNWSCTYDFRGNAGPKYLIQNYQQWVQHNGDGSKGIGVSGYHNANNGPYLTTGNTSFGMGLTTIARYANITAFNVGPITDVGFTIYAAADNNCSNIEYSIDGGASWTSMGGGTSQSATISNLPSGATYNTYVRLTRADSGLQTTSGVNTVTTAPQQSFISLL